MENIAKFKKHAEYLADQLAKVRKQFDDQEPEVAKRSLGELCGHRVMGEHFDELMDEAKRVIHCLMRQSPDCIYFGIYRGEEVR